MADDPKPPKRRLTDVVAMRLFEGQLVDLHRLRPGVKPPAIIREAVDEFIERHGAQREDGKQ